MVQNFFFITIALLAVVAFSGCQTPYGGGGGCPGGPCAAPTTTYAPYQSQSGSYVPNTPTMGGGSGSR